MMESFWLVWCPTGSTPPSYKHNTSESAETEARRLAGLVPDREFYVLKAESMSVKQTVVTHRLYEDGQVIPF